MDENYLENVRSQYERYPYPPRNPTEEARRLLEVEIDRLAVINFYCFKAQNNFEGARVLVAGGGTGDSAIYLGEQLLGKNAEIVYLDISQSSLERAKQRAAVRKLDNITWRHGSILALNPETAGVFDYITCTGVLHHLDDPAAGLRALRSVLKPAGGMGLMLYAKYGRTGIYQLQHLLRLINTNETDLSDKIANTRLLLGDLPDSNWFRHNERFLSDHTKLGDSGLVDLLLHEQDVAYSIDEIHTLLAGAGLHLTEFSDVRARVALRPESFIQDPTLRRKIAQLDSVTQQSIAELLIGAVRQHSFYASPTRDAQAQLGALTDIPFFMPEWKYRAHGPEIAQAIRASNQRIIPMRHMSGSSFDITADPINAAIFEHIDGARDWRDIFTRARATLGNLERSDEDLLAFFAPTFELFRQFDWLLLRAGHVPAFTDTIALQAETERRIAQQN